ncbi:MAG TPA: hypothetical protein VGC15_09840 [Acetobacteraceae bacterium]
MPAINAMQDGAPRLAVNGDLRLNGLRAMAGAALSTPATFAAVPGPADGGPAAA